MGLFSAIDEFFTGPATEVEMMSASTAAQRLNELQDEEETFGLAEKSSTIRQSSSLSSNSSGSTNDSGSSVKLLPDKSKVLYLLKATLPSNKFIKTESYKHIDIMLMASSTDNTAFRSLNHPP